MKKVPLLVIGLLIVVIVIFFFSCPTEDKPEPTVAIDLTTRDIGITLIEKQWKVPTIEVSRGDTVVWRAPQESDVYIQFMDRIIVGSYTLTIEKGQYLSRVIGPEAQKGSNPYAVFIYEDSVYAQSESPPRLIVR